MLIRGAVAAILLFTTAIPTNEFVPRDVINARLVGCFVGGEKGQPDYAEAFVIVRYGNLSDPNRRVDFSPVIARRTMEQGGAPAAIEDCRAWLEDVKKQMEKTAHERNK